MDFKFTTSIILMIIIPIILFLGVIVNYETNIIDIDNCTIIMHDNNGIVSDHKCNANIRIRRRNNKIISINVVKVYNNDN